MMNDFLKEQIIDKAYNTANIEKYVWDNSSLKLIELHLLSFYEVNGQTDEESENRFIENIEFETDKSKFLKETFEYKPPTLNEILDEFVECQTVNEFINTILDGYGLVLTNETIVYFKEI